MSAPAGTDQRLPESADVGYAEPPKSIGLYVDATKWIVGLATGSFLLSGSILTGAVTGRWLALLAGLAVLAMAAAAGAGVRALLCYTRLANLIEVHAARRPFEVSVRNDGYADVRWVTPQRVARGRRIEQWLAGGNLAYSCMTWAFGAGLVLYLAFGAAYLGGGARDATVVFSPTPAPHSPVLGVLHDEASQSSCVVMRASGGVECRAAVVPRALGGGAKP